MAALEWQLRRLEQAPLPYAEIVPGVRRTLLSRFPYAVFFTVKGDLEEGKPKRRDAFKPGYLADLRLMAAAGGEKKKRGEGKTRPGPLFPLMGLALPVINEDALSDCCVVWPERIGEIVSRIRHGRRHC